MPLICREDQVIGDLPVVYCGFGVIYNEEGHWFKRRDYTNFLNTPLVMRYINPDQCVIVLRSSVQECEQHDFLTINNSDDIQKEQWNALNWDELCKQCIQLKDLRDQEPNWHIWLRSPMYVIKSSFSMSDMSE